MNKIKKKLKDKLGEQRIVPLKKALKVGRIVKNVICWTLIAILAVAVVVFLVTKASGGTPTVFGYSLHRIVSGSMIPELEIGDVIVSTKVTDTSDIHMGDIITFQGGSSFDHQKVTHRVLVAPYNDGRGNTVLVTKGDANEIDDGEIDFSNVESKYLSKVTFLKDIYNFFFSPWGLIIFIILLLLIFFDEIINIVKISIHSAEQKQSEPVSDIIKRIELEQQAKTEQQTMLDDDHSEIIEKTQQLTVDPEKGKNLKSRKKQLKNSAEKKKQDKTSSAKTSKNKTNRNQKKTNSKSYSKNTSNKNSNHSSKKKSKKKKKR